MFKNITFQFTDSDNCTVDTLLTISQILAINEKNNFLDLTINPNPNQGTFYILSNNNENINVDHLIIKNIYGQILLDKEFKSNHIINNTPISIQSISNQILFLELRKNNQTLFLDKILIQN